MSEPVCPEARPGPARPARLTVDFYEDADALVLHRRRPGGPAWFLLLWLIGWTVGCVLLLVKVIQEPSLGMIAFGVPFWASWLFVAGMLVWMLFGTETLLLSRDEAIFRRTAFIRLSSRVVPEGEIQGFRECRSRHTENVAYQWGIEMVTLGKPVQFGSGLPDGERAWLIYRLCRFLGKSVPGEASPSPQPPAEAAPAVRANAARAADRTPVLADALTRERTLAAPPTDCRWQLADDGDEFEFWQKGRWDLGALAGLLFVNVFWNGIVLVFMLMLFGRMPGNNPPQGWEWWGISVFLIPFEAIGLGMFAALVLAVLEPWRRSAWRFEGDRIVSETRWPVFRQTRTFEVFGLDRLELRRHSGGGGAGQSRAVEISAGLDGPMPFELVLVARDNVDLCDQGNLTEGEARWMAGVLLSRRPNWFGKGVGRRFGESGDRRTGRRPLFGGGEAWPAFMIK